MGEKRTVILSYADGAERPIDVELVVRGDGFEPLEVEGLSFGYEGQMYYAGPSPVPNFREIEKSDRTAA